MPLWINSKKKRALSWSTIEIPEIEEPGSILIEKDFVELKDCFNLITKGKSLKTKALWEDNNLLALAFVVGDKLLLL